MIQAIQLCKDFGTTRAVDNLNMKAEKGEILGLLGPNGAGKTTTLRMLTGFIRPGSGTVLIKGSDIREDPLNAKKRIGYLPESAPLIPEMTSYDYLMYTGRLRGLEKEALLSCITETAALCRIGEAMDKTISTLSKGYRQRVGLCSVLLGSPEILVLDEPTSGLDPNQITGIRRLIRKLGRTRTIVFSTHILSEAEAVCDRIMILNRGKLAAEGTSQRLRDGGEAGQLIRLELAGGTEKEYLKSLSLLEGVRVQEVIKPKKKGSPFCTILLQTDRDRRNDIYRIIKESPWVLREMSRRQKSLEQIFSEITRGGKDEK